MTENGQVGNDKGVLITDQQLDRIIAALPQSGWLDKFVSFLQPLSALAAIFAVFWAAWGNQELLAQIQVQQSTSIVVEYAVEVQASRSSEERISINVSSKIKNNGALPVGIEANLLYLWIGTENETDKELAEFPILLLNRPGEIGKVSWKRQLVNKYSMYDSVNFLAPGVEDAASVTWEVNLPTSYKYICISGELVAANQPRSATQNLKKTQVVVIK